MEPLENIALEGKLPEKAEKDASVLYRGKSENIEKPYEGLTLVEDERYKGGTSIKYWM